MSKYDIALAYAARKAATTSRAYTPEEPLADEALPTEDIWADDSSVPQIEPVSSDGAVAPNRASSIIKAMRAKRHEG